MTASFRHPVDAIPHSIQELRWGAKEYVTDGLECQVEFDEHHYVRKILHRDGELEVALLCWDVGQSSSIHDHRGSNCVVRILSGRFLERHFQVDAATGLYVETGSNMLEAGNVSGLDGRQIHQISNVVARERGVMLNFYSPPFS